MSFEQLSDIFGFRVDRRRRSTTATAALGVVHTTWPMVPGRFKDYISTPKQNDYRSIHTTVVGPGSQRVELQIRTAEMDEVAEYGIAAHALYKDGAAADLTRCAGESRAYQWLRRTVDILAEGDNPEEFLEHTKLELFHDQVFCFTPKGRLIALPRGATPIDFAYAVHTDVGNTAVGCQDQRPHRAAADGAAERRRGRDRPRRRAGPPAAWESLVVTGKARAAIRRATRAAVRKQYAGLGRQILERAFERGRQDLLRRKAEGGAAAPGPRARSRTCWPRSDGARCSPATSCKAVYPDYKDERRRAGGDASERRLVRPRRPQDASFKGKLPERPAMRPAPFRSAASTANFRCASRPKAAPCRATASSAS